MVGAGVEATLDVVERTAGVVCFELMVERIGTAGLDTTVDFVGFAYTLDVSSLWRLDGWWGCSSAFLFRDEFVAFVVEAFVVAVVFVAVVFVAGSFVVEAFVVVVVVAVFVAGSFVVTYEVVNLNSSPIFVGCFIWLTLGLGLAFSVLTP